MALAQVYSRGQTGIEAPEVRVEVHLANGLPSFTIVGLPEAAVKESKDRVRAALVNCGFAYPTQRITVNLAPADLPKEGGRFDLAIALGILAASGQLPSAALADHEFLGELSLSGELRPICGALPAALHCRRAGRSLLLPNANAAEAALVEGLAVFGAGHLLEVCAHLTGRQSLAKAAPPPLTAQPASTLDYAEVRGHHQAKRAIEVAAAGGHNLLLIGPPGSGKSMLAERLPTILPPLSEAQALEVAAIASVSGQAFDPARFRQPPFRAPHHTASAPALVGGGVGGQIRPGEISLAHLGVLFLDELPEFHRKVLEVLREPMESGYITISRAVRKSTFPARFQLIAAMNPCPCGYHGDPSGRCQCSPIQIARYRERLSGPLLDRIDIHLEVPCQTEELLSHSAQRTSAQMRAQVLAARERALERQGKLNAHLSVSEIERFCQPDSAARALLTQAIAKLGLSHRALHRILKVARTIADLEASGAIGAKHVSEAIGYRRLDRKPAQLLSSTR
ncbi:YifB family Mg chelatase-like AAA ATPase [Methylothermus subterraneus]